MDQAMKFVQLHHNRWGMFHFLFLFWLVKLFIIVTFSTTSSIWAIFITVSTLITRQGDDLVGPSCFSFQFLTRSESGKLISVLHFFSLFLKLFNACGEFGSRAPMLNLQLTVSFISYGRFHSRTHPSLLFPFSFLFLSPLSSPILPDPSGLGWRRGGGTGVGGGAPPAGEALPCCGSGEVGQFFFFF